MNAWQSSTQRGTVMVKKRKRLHGTVDKILKSPHPSQPEKVQITIEEADDLYKEVRLENALTDDKGETSKLKDGARVDVIVEADTDATMKKPA